MLNSCITGGTAWLLRVWPLQELEHQLAQLIPVHAAEKVFRWWCMGATPVLTLHWLEDLKVQDAILAEQTLR